VFVLRPCRARASPAAAAFLHHTNATARKTIPEISKTRPRAATAKATNRLNAPAARGELRAENRIVTAKDPSGAVELTRRAILTGVVIGAALTPCNVYSGLKIGWSFNMSIAAGLLGAGLWRLACGMGGARPFGLLENDINRTAASSAASIVSGGPVAPIPALAFWVFAVSALGIVVAAGLRRLLR
jgi:hypothetical protein